MIQMCSCLSLMTSKRSFVKPRVTVSCHSANILSYYCVAPLRGAFVSLFSAIIILVFILSCELWILVIYGFYVSSWPL